jgi:hypothetical protein
MVISGLSVHDRSTQPTLSFVRLCKTSDTLQVNEIEREDKMMRSRFLELNRQISGWRSRQPLLVLLGLAVPATLLLSSSANCLWGMLYVQLNARLHYGVRYKVGVSSTALLFIFVCQAAAPRTWSCVNGFAIGALVDVAEDALVLSPDAGREHGQFAEMLRMTESR